ncbi:gag [Acrasis kona]|uniref:Gag n=1 Tax=Acrasis kona TaxID=1008807 RepID=A0AAW2YIR8_9EUKA
MLNTVLGLQWKDEATKLFQFLGTQVLVCDASYNFYNREYHNTASISEPIMMMSLVESINTSHIRTLEELKFPTASAPPLDQSFFSSFYNPFVVESLKVVEPKTQTTMPTVVEAKEQVLDEDGLATKLIDELIDYTFTTCDQEWFKILSRALYVRDDRLELGQFLVSNQKSKTHSKVASQSFKTSSSSSQPTVASEPSDVSTKINTATKGNGNVKSLIAKFEKLAKDNFRDQFDYRSNRLLRDLQKQAKSNVQNTFWNIFDEYTGGHFSSLHSQSIASIDTYMFGYMLSPLLGVSPVVDIFSSVPDLSNLEWMNQAYMPEMNLMGPSCHGMFNSLGSYQPMSVPPLVNHSFDLMMGMPNQPSLQYQPLEELSFDVNLMGPHSHCLPTKFTIRLLSRLAHGTITSICPSSWNAFLWWC